MPRAAPGRPPGQPADPHDAAARPRVAAARTALAPLLLPLGLRRAVAAADLGRVRALLAIAMDFGLIEGAAPRQAIALLRRCRITQAWVGRRPAAA